MQNNKKVKGTKSRLPIIAATEQYLAKHTHMQHWQPLIIGNPNYNGLQLLLKLLIITPNNYSVPDLPWERGWSNYTPSLSVSESTRQLDSRSNTESVREISSTRPLAQYGSLSGSRRLLCVGLIVI